MKKIIVLIFWVFSLTQCSIDFLDDKKYVLGQMKNKNYQIRLVYSPSNATIQSSIQVQKKISNSNDYIILKLYQRYNFVDTFYLRNNNELVLVLRDTASILGNKPDTIFVKLE